MPHELRHFRGAVGKNHDGVIRPRRRPRRGRSRCVTSPERSVFASACWRKPFSPREYASLPHTTARGSKPESRRQCSAVPEQPTDHCAASPPPAAAARSSGAAVGWTVVPETTTSMCDALRTSRVEVLTTPTPPRSAAFAERTRARARRCDSCGGEPRGRPLFTHVASVASVTTPPASWWLLFRRLRKLPYRHIASEAKRSEAKRSEANQTEPNRAEPS